MAINGGDILLESLERHGVEYIFCSPGTEWSPVWEGLARRQQQGEGSLKYINCRHESLAVSAAMGHAEATGRLSAVLLHASVGPLHGALAMRTARRNRVPMVVLTADTSGLGEEYKGMDMHWMTLLSDIGGPYPMLQSCAKWSNVITSKDTLIDSVNRGCQMALKAPRGPVFLTIPRDLMWRSFTDPGTPRSLPSTMLPGQRPEDLEEVARLLVESRHPIIITEHAGKSPKAVGKLVELAELLSIPVFESAYPTAVNFPKDHPLHMGYDPMEALKEADTVFVVRATSPWYPPSAAPQNGAKVILLDEDPLKEQLPFWGYPIDFYLTADTAQCLSDLVETLRTLLKQSGQGDSQQKTRLERYQRSHDELVEQAKAEARAGQGNRPISPKWFLYMLNKLMPENAVIVEETITHRRIVHRYLTAPESIVRASAGGLGIGLGLAAGQKLAHPDRPVIFLVGDGTFNYNPVVAGLGVCQEYKLPVLTIVFNNGGYIAMKGSHRRRYPEGAAATNDAFLGVDIAPAPDYAKLSEVFGGYGARLESPEDIEPAIKKALEQLAAGRSALLDVVMDPNI